MEYQQPALSKKLANGVGGLSGKHVYNGVFGGAVKSGARKMEEDYREIFGGSSNCSIPILDFPDTKETKPISSPGDVRSAKPDYSMIFGGFGEGDFAVPYEELLAKKHKVNSFSKAVRSPGETRFDPATPKGRHSNISESRQAPVPEVFPQPLDSGKQFNVSYNKSNQLSKNGTNGMVHIAQLHSVPGYACLIDETTPSQMTDCAKPVRTVLNDAHLNIDVSGIKSEKHLRKVVSGPQPKGPAIDAPTSHAEFRRRASRNKSFSNDISFEAYKIGPDAPPSTMSPLSSAPNMGNNRRGSMRSMNSTFEVFKRDYSEGTTGSSSPPLFDEEIDANSDAATSAAALRKAIEEAQAKMKLAKELMEKKRHGFHHRAKSSSNISLKAERRDVKAADKANTYEEVESQEMHHKVYAIPKQAFSNLQENTTKESEVTPDLKNTTGETRDMESKCSPVNQRLEAESGKATNGLSETAIASEHRVTAIEIEQAAYVEKMKPSTDENVSKEKMAGEENSKTAMQCDKKLKAFDEVPMQEKVERVLNSVASAFKWDIFRNIIKSDVDNEHQKENEDKTRVACKHEKAGQIPEVPCEQDQREIERLNEPGKEAKSETQDMAENKCIGEVKEAEGWVRIEKKETEACDQDEVENQSNEVSFGKENEKGLQEIDLNEGNEERQKEDDVPRPEDTQVSDHVHKQDDIQDDVPRPEDTQISDHVHRQDDVEVSISDFQEKEESEARHRSCGAEGNENLEDGKENGKMLDQIHDNETGHIYEGVETGLMQVEIHPREDDETIMELTQQSFRCQYNIEATGDEDNNDTAGKSAEAYEHEKFGSMQEVEIKMNDNAVEITGDSFAKETEKGSNGVEEASNLVEDDNFEADIPEQGLIGIKQQKADVYLGKTDSNFDSQVNGCHLKEDARVSVQERLIEELSCHLDENTMDVSGSETSLNEEETGSDIASSHSERWSDNGREFNKLCGPEKQVEETSLAIGKNSEEAKKPGVATSLEDENYFEFPSDKKYADSRIVGQASQQQHTFEGEEKSMRTSHEVMTKESIENDGEGHHETGKAEARDAEDTSQKKIELEKKHPGRREEMKLRETEKDKEREKERIAVERAIREARERAFAEARERAERAAAEKAAAGAQQRVMAEARERLEKARAEANGKSSAEKACMEAKLKAERAAVERATAEARERALERALSQKTSFKARNQAEKFGPENLSGVSRDSGLKFADQQYKGPAPSSSSKDLGSSNDAPSTERFSGASGESVERCKATLERNQRTAERAAKALAEKNMRDLLAQKEQAERNRLAEILDADVKRWSSGKERNLRALLSTLQYILGHDSGWQAIPLTELISTAAVKKAYRKATLFVHPDKLQQRGASIQQKYICEKVFDLLKDAWNKFGAEER